MFTCSAKTREEKRPGSLGAQGPDAASSKTSFSTSPKGADIPKNPIGFPTNPARCWLLPSCTPTSHHKYRATPCTTRRSTLDDWATSNKFHAMCFVPTHIFAVRTGTSHSSGSSKLDRNGGLAESTFVRVSGDTTRSSAANLGVFTTPLAESATAPKHTDFRHTAHRLEKERCKHRIVECVRRHLQAQGKLAGRIDPCDCGLHPELQV